MNNTPPIKSFAALAATLHGAPPTVRTESSIKISLTAFTPIREGTSSEDPFVGCSEMLGHFDARGIFHPIAIIVPAQGKTQVYVTDGDKLVAQKASQGRNVEVHLRDIKPGMGVLRAIYKPLKGEDGTTEVETSFLFREISFDEKSVVQSVTKTGYKPVAMPLIAPLPQSFVGNTLTTLLSRLRFTFVTLLAARLAEEYGDDTILDLGDEALELIKVTADQMAAEQAVNAHATRHQRDVSTTIAAMCEAAAARRK